MALFLDMVAHLSANLHIAIHPELLNVYTHADVVKEALPVRLCQLVRGEVQHAQVNVLPTEHFINLGASDFIFATMKPLDFGRRIENSHVDFPKLDTSHEVGTDVEILERRVVANLLGKQGHISGT